MLRMRKIKRVLLCLLCATLAGAQSPKDMAKALESSLANQQLVLKNFSGEETVQTTWSGTGLVLEQPQWREFGIFNVNAVKLKGQKLTLRCTRHGVVRDGSGRTEFYGQPTKVNLDIDLQGADPKQALPLVREALFFPSVEDALAAIPKSLQKLVPFQIDAPRPPGKTDVAKSCDCSGSGITDCNSAGKNAEVQPPKYLHGTDPHYSNDARNARLNGKVIVQFIVDKTGSPRDMWVLRPLGLGLDEAAAKSVFTYSFQPATCSGNPVSVYLNVEVNFQVY
jgi:TonB family protein